MLCRLIVSLPLLVLFHFAEGAPDSATALNKAEQMQQQMRHHTTDIFKQADALTKSSKFLDELNQSATKFSEFKIGPKTTLPEFPDLDPAQLARTRTTIGQLLNQTEQHKRLTDPNHSNKSQFYIFVSFSMPDLTLQRLMEQAQRISAPLVLRGLINNDMNQTRIKISQLMGADKLGKATNKGGLTIDPTLYERFGISVVPAFVLTATPAPTCTQTDCPTPDFVRLAGNVTLDYVLETMGKATPAMRDHTNSLLGTLRGKTQ